MPTRPTRHNPGVHVGRRSNPDAWRPSASRRGYGRRWEAASKGYLRSHPVCVHCLAKGLTVASSEVDHIIPHRGDMALFWNRANWQALCHACHSAKTVRDDGGFGNRRKDHGSSTIAERDKRP